MAETQTGGGAVVALTHLALEASSEALARAKSAGADLLDTGETRAEHEAARDRHHQAADFHHRLAEHHRGKGDCSAIMAHDSAAARHAAAGAAHQFARGLGEACADDPKEDGFGMELRAAATSAALPLSARAHRATLAACNAI